MASYPITDIEGIEADVAARLKAAGIPEGAITYFATPEHPKDGGLVAIYPGTSKTLKPMLLLGHIDVICEHSMRICQNTIRILLSMLSKLSNDEL